MSQALCWCIESCCIGLVFVHWNIHVGTCITLSYFVCPHHTDKLVSVSTCANFKAVFT